MSSVKRFVDEAMDRFRGFSVFDVAVFKTCLLTIGMLLGISNVRTMRKIQPFLWIFLLCSYIYLIWRMVLKDEA